MVIHIKDGYTDERVRLLAKRLGVGITTAIREAVDEKLAREAASNDPDQRAADLFERLKPLLDKVDALPRKATVPDKRFFDELWGEDDD